VGRGNRAVDVDDTLVVDEAASDAAEVAVSGIGEVGRGWLKCLDMIGDHP